MNIDEIRIEIDKVDEKIADLFCERLEMVKQISKIKADKGIDVLDRKRENNIIKRLTKSRRFKDELKLLYSAIFKISKDVQSKI